MTSKPRQRPGASSPLQRPRLLPHVEDLKVGDSSQAPGPTEPGAPVLTESQSTEPPESGSPGVPQSQTPGAEDVPRYLTLIRKEARVRADQADALTEIRRQVARQRTDRTEPLTDNTLVRIAIDLLMARRADLAGNTEEELRRSVLPD